MRHLSLAAVLVCALGLLAGCQVGAPGKAASDVTPNAVTGSAIETTPLEAPADTATPAVPAVPAAETKAAGPGKAPVQGAAAPVASESATPEAAAPAPTPAPVPDLAETPVTPKSEMQMACEKKRGKWAHIGKGELHACVYQTRDSGKRCERESQCEGVCLARSGTCSPLKPLYGCNDILQDDGRRVTLCLD
jgi:hypothetical protein